MLATFSEILTNFDLFLKRDILRDRRQDMLIDRVDSLGIVSGLCGDPG